MAPSFLDIEPAVRNEIYQLCAPEVHTICVLPKHSGHITTKHPLHSVCRQIRREFGGFLAQETPIMADTAKTIIGHVVDFNFNPLMAYLNRVPLSAVRDNFQFRTWRTNTKSRKLHIDLEITKAWCENPDVGSLLRFAKWLGKKVGQGGSFGSSDITWKITHIEIEDWKELPIDIFYSLSGDWLCSLKDALKEKLVPNGDAEMQAEDQAIMEAAIAVEGSCVFWTEITTPVYLEYVELTEQQLAVSARYTEVTYYDDEVDMEYADEGRSMDWEQTQPGHAYW